MNVTLSVKNVPREIAQRLKARARSNHRSLQGELLAILESQALSPRLSVEEAFQRVKTMGLKATDDSLKLLREARDSR